MPRSSEPWPGKQNAIFAHAGRSVHFITAEPQVSPAPIPVISTMSPSVHAAGRERLGERERDRGDDVLP